MPGWRRWPDGSGDWGSGQGQPAGRRRSGCGCGGSRQWRRCVGTVPATLPRFRSSWRRGSTFSLMTWWWPGGSCPASRGADLRDGDQCRGGARGARFASDVFL